MLWKRLDDFGLGLSQVNGKEEPQGTSEAKDGQLKRGATVYGPACRRGLQGHIQRLILDLTPLPASLENGRWLRA